MAFHAALLAGVSASAAAAQTITIAALGDSLTQGYGLPPEAGLVPQLDRWLAERGQDVALINAGVSGDTTAGGLARIEWTLTDEVDALILALGGNDLLRGVDPAAVRANLDATLAIAVARDLPVLLVGSAAPDNYGPDYKAAFDSLFAELADKHGALFHDNLLAPLLVIEDRAAARRTYMQADGLHPNAEGVALIVAHLGPAVEALIARARSGD